MPTGARIWLRDRLLTVEPKAGGMALTRQFTVEFKDAEKPALVAEWLGVL